MRLSKNYIRIIALVTTLSFLCVALHPIPTSAYNFSKTLPDSDSYNWNAGSIGNTDIVVQRKKMGMADAQITFSGSTANQFKLQQMTKHYIVNKDGVNLGCYSIKWKGPSANGSISAGTYSFNTDILFKFPKAARVINDGQWYDVYLHITKLSIRVSQNQRYGVPTIYGCGSDLNIGAFTYKSIDENGNFYFRDSGIIGVKYTANVYLKVAGTDTLISNTPEVNYKLAWGFEDVDIRDAFIKTPNHDYYDSDGTIHEWAEHVTLYNVDTNASNLNNGFYGPIYVSKNTELEKVESSTNGDVTIYHEFEEDADFGNEDGGADFIVRVNPAHFRFAWQGSNCSTVFFGIAGTMYTGHSYIYKGNNTTASNAITDLGANKANNQTVEVRANSQDITFEHTIYRNNEGPNDDTESYYVVAGTNSGPSYGTSTSPRSYESEKDKTAIAYTKGTPSGNGFTTNLAPGQEKVLQQTLYYQLSNVNDAMLNYVNMTCTLVTPNKSGTACVKLVRPVAKFTASTGAKIIADGGDAYLTPNNDSAGTEVTEENGNFKIRFTGSITRKANTGTDPDLAGGTAKSPWNVIQTVNGSSVSSSRIPETDKNYTTDLTNGSKDDVIAEDYNTNGYVYSGRLKYGETRDICIVMDYSSVVNAKGGDTTDQSSTCVKVWRQKKKCDINESYEFGVYSGRNLGRIGVVNHSYPGPTSSYSYTTAVPGSFTYKGSRQYATETSIWARPGDSIRFVHETCAGGAYAVNNISSLNNTTYKSVYTAKGYQSSNTNSRYLFGDAIPDKVTNPATPLLYSNTKSWDSSTATNGHFMSGESDEDNEFQLYSPSGSEESSYSRDTHNTSSYSCTNGNIPTSFINSHYQIPGQESASDSCHAYTKTATPSDAGRSIIQSLSWNDMVVNGSAASKTYSNDNTYTATAKVKVPYNYNLQPAISADTELNVAYLGGKANFDIDIYTTPRKNSSFGTDTSKNTYATISKPTSVVIKYYFIKGGRKQADINVKNESGIRFNNTGNSSGTAGMNTTVTEGGYNYHSFSVYIDDSLVVGDKVCAYVTVTPADSHDQYMAETVTGAGTNDNALKENGTSSNSQQRTSCYTIAKKPTMSAESSNAFAGGSKGFVTSRYIKQFNTNGGTEYLFGSWSEYGVYGKVRINNSHGIASGATFGYDTKNDGISTINGARSNSGNSIARNDSAHGSNTCVFSTQTFANADCETATENIGSEGAGTISAEQFRDRIRDRFASSLDESESPSGAICKNTTYAWNEDSACRGSDGRNYVGADARDHIKIGDRTFKYLRTYINNKFDDNGINHTLSKEDAYLGAAEAKLTLWASHNFGNAQEYIDEETGERYADRNYTRLIQVTNSNHNATLIIDSDIKVGYYKKYKNAWGQTIEDTDNDPELHNSGEIVNFIIIADNVEITSRVNQIDAIIIANNINTCSYDTTTRLVEKRDAMGRLISRYYSNDLREGIKSVIGSNISADTCNEELHFRSPVATRQITLNRTFGAENGTSSIKRAEIFEMNPYTYLWSYGQMSRYSQAVTVFSRELPARY